MKKVVTVLAIFMFVVVFGTSSSLAGLFDDCLLLAGGPSPPTLH